MVKLVHINPNQVNTLKKLKWLQHQTNVLVFIYHPKCPFCKKVIPAWKALVKTLEKNHQNDYSIVALNKEVINNLKTQNKSNAKFLGAVKTVPKIIIYNKNKPNIDYNGNRSYSDLLKFSLNHLHLRSAKSHKSKHQSKRKTPSRKNKTKSKRT